MNREQWLTALSNAALPRIASRIELANEEAVIRLSCGFPAQQGKRSPVVACIVPPANSDDFTAEVFVSPIIAQGYEVAAAVLPLLCAAITGDFKNGNAYRTAVRANGLNAATLPSWADSILQGLGSYPHAAVTLEAPVKQTARLLKVCCNGDLMNGTQHDSYIVRISRNTLTTYGAPICPVCSDSLVEAN